MSELTRREQFALHIYGQTVGAHAAAGRSLDRSMLRLLAPKSIDAAAALEEALDGTSPQVASVTDLLREVSDWLRRLDFAGGDPVLNYIPAPVSEAASRVLKECAAEVKAFEGKDRFYAGRRLECSPTTGEKKAGP